MTKKHSLNPIAAKARRRMAEPDFSGEIAPRKIRTPRVKARFRIRIDDLKVGDALNLSLRQLPWRGRFLDADGRQLSAAQIQRAIGAILNH